MLTGKAPASCAELLERQFGVKVETRQNPEVAAVGTTAVIVAKNNPRRVGLVFVNLSANTIYLRPEGIPTAALGIIIPAGGGSVSMIWTDDMTLPALEWQAVASGAASAFYSLEVLIGRGRE